MLPAAARRRARSRAAGAVAALTAIVALGTFLALGPFAAAAAPAPVLSVGGALSSPPVAPGFVGISLEYSAVPAYARDPAMRPALVRLIQALAPGQRPVLRIGGDSTDWSQVPVAGKKLPAGDTYVLTPRWMATFGALVRALHARVIAGVNLEDGSATLAAAEARALIAAAGPGAVQALEVGNEPELYGSFPWYTTRAGVHITGRPHGYDIADYAQDFAAYARVLPPVPLAGPATGGAQWMQELQQFVPRAPRLGLVTVHLYPLQRCFTPQVSDVYPTIAHLLAPTSSVGLAARAAADVALARARGLPLRVDEMNSVSCRGKAGVSDTFASALWILDALFQMAQTGVSGVNVHTLPGSSYQPFEIVPPSTGSGSHRQWRVSPIYYGMLAFARAVPAGSRLEALSGKQPAQLRRWAVRTPSGQTNVVLINEGSTGQELSLRVPGARGVATITRLQAASLTSTAGVTLGGQSFGARTSTGQLAGVSAPARLRPSQGYYTLSVPPASAAIVSLSSWRRSLRSIRS